MNPIQGKKTFHNGRRFAIKLAVAGAALILIALTAFFILKPTTTAQPRPARNVILVVLDATRADHLGTYGYSRDTDPNLREMAARGAAFPRAYAAAPWTLPSFASILTGLYPLSHGVVGETLRLSNKAETLAEVFRSRGYHTAAITANPFLRRESGLDQGFDDYVEIQVKDRDREVTSPSTLAAALGWIETHRAGEFFLLVHFMDAHHDYIPPSPYNELFDPGYRGPVDGRGVTTRPDINPSMPAADRKHLLALYDGEIRWTDEHLGKLRNKIREYGLDDKTVIAVTADHGEGFFEHGQKTHGYGLTNELLRVPLVIEAPGRRIAPLSGPVSGVDIYPTLLDLAGIPCPEGIDGRSLADPEEEKRNGDVRPHPVVAELQAGEKHQVAFMENVTKLIRDISGDRFELYDLAADPGEEHDLASLQPGKVAELRKALSEWTKARKRFALKPSQIPSIEQETRERLKALGYIK